MKLNQRYGALLFLLTVFLLAGCNGGGEQANKNKKQPPAHRVEITRAEIRDISLRQTLPGTLQAVRSVKVFNQEEGLLKGLPFFEGDRVSQDTEIAHLDDALIRAELGKASATLKQAQLDLKRIKNLLPRKLASEDEVAKARTAVEVAKSEVERQRIRLDYTHITAPFDGTISERLVEPGDVIGKLSHLLTLIDTSSLKATVYVSELLLPLIKINDPVSMRIDALGDRSFDARIMRIHPVIDANTRRGVIEVELTPVPEQALPGQLCRITLDTHKKPRLMIPFDAMRNDNEGAFVYRVIDDKAVKTPIRTGLQRDNQIEVLDGLKENDVIVAKGFFGLKNNQVVQIVNGKQPDSATAKPKS